jgi:hypothetical protein
MDPQYLNIKEEETMFNKIIVSVNPVRATTLFIFKDGELQEQIKVFDTNEVADTVVRIAARYDIDCIDIAGNFNYSAKYGQEIAEKSISKYSKTLSIQYIKNR